MDSHAPGRKGHKTLQNIDYTLKHIVPKQPHNKLDRGVIVVREYDGHLGDGGRNVMFNDVDRTGKKEDATTQKKQMRSTQTRLEKETTDPASLPVE